ncbi:MAG: electron transport complex subunit RsxC [Eubacteriales bacterium]
MKKLSFRGGLHVHDGKSLSKDKAIKELLPVGDMVYPLSQHIGAPATPIVAKGDTVLAGQKIAEAGGFISACIHATVSGTVKGIEPRRVATGDLINSIIVENDGQYEEVEFIEPEPYEEMSREEVVERIKEAGIVGMGGAGFPTHVKASPKEPNLIEYVIVNCAECEPYLTSDYRRMIEEPEKLFEGLRILLHIFPFAQGIIGIEDNKDDCIKKMQRVCRRDNRISVATLQTKYPQGAERQLIYATTKRAMHSAQLPTNIGCVVQNADTIVAIQQALQLGRPLMNRIVTITGDAIANPCNFKVRIGTNCEELIEAAGGFIKEPGKLISGGPMMGFSLFDLSIPATKTSSALLCLVEDEVSKCEESSCINCGKCSQVCPSRILPALLADCSNHNDEEQFVACHGMECVECGCCSYVCPAKRGLTQSIKSMKKTQIAKRRK